MILKAIVFLLTFYSFIFADDPVIKSLRAFNSSNQTSAPIITHGERLTIEFDIAADLIPDLVIVFRFCDKDWKPVENIFLDNTGFNTAYNLWFESVPVTNSGADYFFSRSFPDDDVTFPYSGKWKYYITDSYDTSIVYATGKFIAAYGKIPIYSKLRKRRYEGSTLSESTLGQVNRIYTDIILPDSLYSSRVLNLEITENRKFDQSIIIDKGMNENDRYFEWNGINELTFIADNIQPGNEYRQTNLMDRNKHEPPDTHAQYDGIEVSRYYVRGDRDFNGGSKLRRFDNVYAVYMDVLFEFRPVENFKDDIFITGSFNNWELSPDYKLGIDDGVYYTWIELKRGIYDYQYVTGNYSDGEIENADWFFMEGNSWKTNNDYYIFLYYKSEELGEYEEIIGFTKISSGE